MIENTELRKKRGRPRLEIEKHSDDKKVYQKAFKSFQKWEKEFLRSKNDEDTINFLNYAIKRYESQNSSSIDNKKIKMDMEYQTIGENIGKCYNILHHTSPLKYPLINILSKNVSQVFFSKITGIDTQVIKRASLCDNFSILTDFSTNINRKGGNALDDNIVLKITEWIKHMCPVPSGSKYPKHLQCISTHDLYDTFVASCLESPELQLVSLTTFMNIRSKINIRLSSFDFSSFCPFCFNENNSLVNNDDDDDDDDDDENIEKSITLKKSKEEHLLIVNTQNEKFREIQKNLGQNEVLLVMDFTAYGIPYAKSQFLYLNDLIITIYENGGKHNWINYVSTSENKQMYFYVEGSLYDLFSTYLQQNISKIYIFSDGGPKHFKINKTINFFHYLAKYFNIKIEYHFFESYHGASLCDAHAGHVKCAIRNIIRDGTQIKTLNEFLEKIKEKNLKNCTFIKMVPLKESMVKVVKKIPRIKSYYKFSYDGEKIDIFSLSSNQIASKSIKF